MSSGGARPSVNQPQALNDVLLGARALLEDADGGVPDVTDRALFSVNETLRKDYLRHGGPHLTLTRCLEVASWPALESRKRRGSVEVARLHSFIADLYLATGPVGAKSAAYHAQLALEEINYVMIVTGRARQIFVNSTLAWGVAQKMTGSMGAAHTIIRDAITTIPQRLGGSPLYLIPLIRQELMMQQTLKSHQALAATATGYASIMPKEYYGTVKRVFEFLLNNRRLGEAERLLPEFTRAFKAVARQLSPISLVSFQKNMGQYYLSKGLLERGVMVLTRAFMSAQRLGLSGQASQIRILLEASAGGGTDLKLITASLEMGR